MSGPPGTPAATTEGVTFVSRDDLKLVDITVVHDKAARARELLRLATNMNNQYKTELHEIVEYLSCASTQAVNDSKSCQIRYSLANSNRDPDLYSSRARLPPASKPKQPQEPKNTTHVNCYITPSENQSADDCAAEVKRLVVKSNCNIRSVYKNSKNKIVVECNDGVNASKASSIITSGSSLKSEVDTPKARLKFSNVEKSMPNSDFLSEMKQRDDRFKDEQDLEVLFSFETKNKKCVVIRMDLNKAKIILRNPETFIGHGVVYIAEFVDYTSCFKCGRLDHRSKNCTQPPSCTRCGETDHSAGDCPNSPKCVNCTEHNKNHPDQQIDAGHPSNSRLCSIREAHIDSKRRLLNDQ